MKHFLSIGETSKEELFELFALTDEIKREMEKKGKDLKRLEGKSIISLFYENSTRTRVSFEKAVTFLGGNFSAVSIATSSVQKGETLRDTCETLDSLETDLYIMRHSLSGAAKQLSQIVKGSVINAGDGLFAHPTQALLDFYTMGETFGSLEGLNVTIVGDIKHSRVARSNMVGLEKLGGNVTVFAPNTMLPAGIEKMAKVAKTREEAFENADVIMGLRIQLERQEKGLFPSLKEFNKHFGITKDSLKNLKKKPVIMHPGPVNRNVEIDEDLIYSSQSLINRQVHNGLLTRMALLCYLLEGKQC